MSADKQAEQSREHAYGFRWLRVQTHARRAGRRRHQLSAIGRATPYS